MSAPYPGVDGELFDRIDRHLSRLDATPKGAYAILSEVAYQYRRPISEVFDWALDDQAAAAAAILNERHRAAGVCRQCGTDPKEWEGYGDGHRPRLKAGVHVCPGCRELAPVDKSIDDDARRYTTARLLPRVVVDAADAEFDAIFGPPKPVEQTGKRMQ